MGLTRKLTSAAAATAMLMMVGGKNVSATDVSTPYMDEPMFIEQGELCNIGGVFLGGETIIAFSIMIGKSSSKYPQRTAITLSVISPNADRDMLPESLMVRTNNPYTGASAFFNLVKTTLLSTTKDNQILNTVIGIYTINEEKSLEPDNFSTNMLKGKELIIGVRERNANIELFRINMNDKTKMQIIGCMNK